MNFQEFDTLNVNITTLYFAGAITCFFFCRTIPNTPVQCDNYDCNTDLRYGMHESFNYYLRCKQRERNMGLFTADQVKYIAALNCDCPLLWYSVTVHKITFIHQVTAMLATSKIVLLPGHNYLLTTSSQY